MACKHFQHESHDFKHAKFIIINQLMNKAPETLTQQLIWI